MTDIDGSRSPTTVFGMWYCRACGWVEAVRASHPETGPKPTCPNCGPFGPGLFDNSSGFAEHDYAVTLMERGQLVDRLGGGS